MKIKCPSCDQRLEIPEELAGQTIECPACNTNMAAPAPPLPTPPPPIAPTQNKRKAPQATTGRKTKSPFPKWAIASVAGLAVLVVLSIIFFSDETVKTDGESQQSTAAAEAKPIERVAGSKAPEISIHEAAFNGNIEAVKQHLAAGADVNMKNEDDLGATPLHQAADNGHKEIAELLIINDADVNAKDKDGETPLHKASSSGEKEIIELLIAKGADVNAKDNSSHEWTPIAVASSPEIIKLFRKHGGKYAEELK